MNSYIALEHFPKLNWHRVCQLSNSTTPLQNGGWALNVKMPWLNFTCWIIPALGMSTLNMLALHIHQAVSQPFYTIV